MWKFLAILECKVQNITCLIIEFVTREYDWHTKLESKPMYFGVNRFMGFFFLLNYNGFIRWESFPNKKVLPKHPHTYLSVFSTNCTLCFSWKQVC
jgi:hypothetical protein